MTKYIDQLKKQRVHLARTAQSASYFLAFMSRWSDVNWSTSVRSDVYRSVIAARADVKAMDAKIEKESKTFGALRFKVMGPV